MIQDPDNLLAQDKLFLGYLARSQIKKLLSEGDISQFEYDNFFDACQAFHKEAFLYAVKWFPLNDDLLKEAAFLNILDQKSCFQDILSISKKLEKYIKFTSNELVEMQQEFLLLQSIMLDDLIHLLKKKHASELMMGVKELTIVLMFCGITYMK